MESDCRSRCAVRAEYRLLGCVRTAGKHDSDLCGQECRLAHLRIRTAVHMVPGNQSNVHLPVRPASEYLLGMAIETPFRAGKRYEDGNWLRAARNLVPRPDVFR